jgi:hypothetical protein
VRLLVNATAYGSEPGGAGVRARRLFGALKGHEVVFLLAEDTNLEVVPPGVETRVLPVQAKRRLRRWMNLRLPTDGDVLFTDHYPASELPTVITLHDRGGPAWRRAAIKKQLRRATAVIAVTDTVRRAWGVQATVIPNGAEQVVAQTVQDHLLVCDPGVAHKQVGIAREVAARLGLPLREIGRGVAWLPHDEMLREIAQARVVLCPASEEGAGMVPMEALASGRPVVASDIEAHREVCGTAATFANGMDEWCTAVQSAWNGDATRPSFDAPSWTEAAGLMEAVIAGCCESRTT